MEYLLAIDGGSSKTEFALTDTNGTIIRSVTIPKGTNPWKYPGDFQKVEEIIREGLDELRLPDTIIASAAGISGCHGDSRYRKQYEEIIQSYVPSNSPIFITGDILSSFNALSDEPTGIIAINGSGSSITLLYEDKTSYVFDAVGIAGRDIAINLVMSANNGYYSQEVIQWLESIIGKLPAETNLGTLYHTPQIYLITKELSQLEASHPVRIEVEPYLYSVAVRWATKLWGTSMKYRNVTGAPATDIVPVVLNGSVWQFDFIRETTISLLKDADPNLKILYDPESRPIMGVIKLAKSLISE